MIINVDKESLLKSINIADSVISSKNINTILANCLFHVDKNELEILSTDNEIAVRTKINVVSDSSESFTANGKKFSNIIKELPNDELVIEVNESFRIDIKSKAKELKGHYTLFGTTTDEYPEIPDFKDENSVELDQAVLKETLKKVIYAASTDTVKPVFNGIFLTADHEGTMTAVATDSRRLSKITRAIDNKIDFENGIIIPLKTVNEVYRLLDIKGKCRFSFLKNQCFFKINNTVIISRIVDGQFPNFSQVIPKEFAFEAVIQTRKFHDAVKRAMIFTREPANKIVLHFSENHLLIQASTPELGEAEEELDIKSSGKNKISLGLNALFLSEALREIDSDSIRCGITGQMSPVTLQPENDSNYVSVIMPIQIKTAQSE